MTDRDSKWLNQKDYETNVFVVLNEETLEMLKCDSGRTLKFDTKEDANKYASRKLELWSVFQVAFKHPWIQHEADRVFPIENNINF